MRKNIWHASTFAKYFNTIYILVTIIAIDLVPFYYATVFWCAHVHMHQHSFTEVCEVKKKKDFC